MKIIRLKHLGLVQVSLHVNARVLDLLERFESDVVERFQQHLILIALVLLDEFVPGGRDVLAVLRRHDFVIVALGALHPDQSPISLRFGRLPKVPSAERRQQSRSFDGFCGWSDSSEYIILHVQLESERLELQGAFKDLSEYCCTVSQTETSPVLRTTDHRSEFNLAKGHLGREVRENRLSVHSRVPPRW